LYGLGLFGDNLSDDFCHKSLLPVNNAKLTIFYC
jgi:hypothetical protein